MTKDDGGPVCYARPERLRLICAAVVLFVAVAFTIAAAVLPSSSDGFSFVPGDQVAIFGIGLAVAAMFWLPTRPRLRADRTGVQVRTIVGNYKTVPWELIQSVEFRAKWRWARLMLPADETISLYAVQRVDGERSVQTMRTLRELHASAQQAALNRR